MAEGARPVFSRLSDTTILVILFFVLGTILIATAIPDVFADWTQGAESAFR